MDRGDFGSGRDPRFPQDNLRIVVMDRLQFLEKLARPLCLPLLAYAARSFLKSFLFCTCLSVENEHGPNREWMAGRGLCQSEARAVLERCELSAWKHRPNWLQRGLVPPPEAPGTVCDRLADEHTRLECGGRNFVKAQEIKGRANDAFRSGRYGDAAKLYGDALELAATVAYRSAPIDGRKRP